MRVKKNVQITFPVDGERRATVVIDCLTNGPGLGPLFGSVVQCPDTNTKPFLGCIQPGYMCFSLIGDDLGRFQVGGCSSGTFRRQEETIISTP